MFATMPGGTDIRLGVGLWQEGPFPALTVRDQHVVMPGYACAITCATCWAALCGCAALRVPSEGIPVISRSVCARSPNGYLLLPWLFVQQVDLPVGALNFGVQLANTPGHFIGLRPQIGDRQGGNEGQLGTQLP